MMKRLITLFFLTAICFAQNKDSLSYYEKQFNPSIYDIKDLIFPKKFITDEDTQLISGYRVQILVTTQLDSANTVRNLAQSILSQSNFQSQKVYIIYEPPNYKVRVGDFEKLEEASLMRKFLVENGFKFAWIVNDRIKRR